MIVRYALRSAWSSSSRRQRGSGRRLRRADPDPVESHSPDPDGRRHHRRRADGDRQDGRVHPADSRASPRRTEAASRARPDPDPRIGGTGGNERPRLRAIHRPSRRRRLRRRAAASSTEDAEDPRTRPPRRDPGAPPRPPWPHVAPARRHRDPGPRRGRPHGRHGLRPRSQAHPPPHAGRAADDDVLGDHAARAEPGGEGSDEGSRARRPGAPRPSRRRHHAGRLPRSETPKDRSARVDAPAHRGGQRHRLRADQARRRPLGPGASAPRPLRSDAAREPVARAAGARAPRSPARPGADPGRHRHRLPRHRRQGHHAHHQLRRAAHARGLRPPDRTHRPRRRLGGRVHADVSRREEGGRRDRAVHGIDDPARHGARFRLRRAEHRALGRRLRARLRPARAGTRPRPRRRAAPAERFRLLRLLRPRLFLGPARAGRRYPSNGGPAVLGSPAPSP
jgi:hypothetical protein